ncbi:hypothetical protein CHS0354_036578 [Potamilus streckersoni]|uniref:XK-related protein n=1 Tax=Potamilus streckersoni TaxID=2493646 RepID=A0AAE0WDK0_9BIVA|nr:hypothetical protein CHS0354_036578 [Potamilus streckersoni]
MTNDEFYLKELPLLMSPSQNSDNDDLYCRSGLITTLSSKEFKSPEPISVLDKTIISFPENVQRYNYFREEIKEADFSNSEAGIVPLDYLDTVGRDSSEASIRVSLEVGVMSHDYLDTVGRGSSGDDTGLFYVNESTRFPLLAYAMGPVSIYVDSTHIHCEGDRRRTVIDQNIAENNSTGKPQILITFRSEVDSQPMFCSSFTDIRSLTPRGALGTRKNVSSENLRGRARLHRLKSNSCSDLTEHRPSFMHRRNASFSGSLYPVRRQVQKNGASGLLTKEERKRIEDRRSQSMRTVLNNAPDEPIIARSASDKALTTRISHNKPAIDPKPITQSLYDIPALMISPPSNDSSYQSLFESDVEKYITEKYYLGENFQCINALTVNEQEKMDPDIILDMKKTDHDVIWDTKKKDHDVIRDMKKTDHDVKRDIKRRDHDVIRDMKKTDHDVKRDIKRRDHDVIRDMKKTDHDVKQDIERRDHDVIRDMKKTGQDISGDIKNNNHVENTHFPFYAIKEDNHWIDQSINEDRNNSLVIDNEIDMETSDDVTVQTPLFTHEESQRDESYVCDTRSKSCKIKMTINVTMAVISIFLYLADIGTDILLAREYFMQDEFSLFWATVVFILVPSALLAIVDLSWFYQDRMEHIGNNNVAYIVVRIVFGVASFGRIFRTMEYVYHGYKWIHATQLSDQVYHETRSKEAARDFRLLDLINVFTESAPQFLLQLIITLYSHDVETMRALSLATSWVSISWTLVSYYDCNRAALPGRNALTIQAYCTYLMAKLSEVSSRIVSVSLFIFVFKIWGVSLLLHLVIMAVWVFCIQKPELEGIAASTLGKALYKLFFSYVLLVCYINLRNDPTLYRMIFYHTLTYTENFAMGGLVLWQMMSQEELTDKYKVLFLIAIPLGFLFHFIFQVLFYRCCHSWSEVSTKRHQDNRVRSNKQEHELSVISQISL